MSIKMGDQYNDTLPPLSLDESIYIEKICNDAFKSIHEAFCETEIELQLQVKKSPEYITYIKDHPEDKELPTLEVAKKSNINVVRLIAQSRTMTKVAKLLVNKEIILNKHTQVYPTITFQDYASSEKGIKSLQKLCGFTDES